MTLNSRAATAAAAIVHKITMRSRPLVLLPVLARKKGSIVVVWAILASGRLRQLLGLSKEGWRVAFDLAAPKCFGVQKIQPGCPRTYLLATRKAASLTCQGPKIYILDFLIRSPEYVLGCHGNLFDTNTLLARSDMEKCGNGSGLIHKGT